MSVAFLILIWRLNQRKTRLHLTFLCRSMNRWKAAIRHQIPEIEE